MDVNDENSYVTNFTTDQFDENNDVRRRSKGKRRSSILKMTKSPKLALEDIDPNTQNSDDITCNVKSKKSRQSSSRRVSFAETCQIKEIPNVAKKSSWPWNDGNNPDTLHLDLSNTADESLYRQPASTLAGLSSLLSSPIQDSPQKPRLYHESDTQDMGNRTSTLDFTGCVGFDGNELERSVHQMDMTENDFGEIIEETKRQPFQQIQLVNGDVSGFIDERTSLEFTRCYGISEEDDVTLNQMELTRNQTLQIIHEEPNETANTSRYYSPSKKHAMEFIRQLDDIECEVTSNPFYTNTQTDWNIKNNFGERTTSLDFTKCYNGEECDDDITSDQMELTGNLGDISSKDASQATANPQLYTQYQVFGQIVGPTAEMKENVEGTEYFNKQDNMENNKRVQSMSSGLLKKSGLSFLKELHGSGRDDVKSFNDQLTTGNIEDGGGNDGNMDMTRCQPVSETKSGNESRIGFQIALDENDQAMDMTRCQPVSETKSRNESRIGFQIALDENVQAMDMTRCQADSEMKIRDQSKRFQIASGENDQDPMDMTRCQPNESKIGFQINLDENDQAMDMTRCQPVSEMKSSNESRIGFQIAVDKSEAYDSNMNMTRCQPFSSEIKGQHDSKLGLQIALDDKNENMDMTTCQPNEIGFQIALDDDVNQGTARDHVVHNARSHNHVPSQINEVSDCTSLVNEMENTMTSCIIDQSSHNESRTYVEPENNGAAPPSTVEEATQHNLSHSRRLNKWNIDISQFSKDNNRNDATELPTDNLLLGNSHIEPALFESVTTTQEYGHGIPEIALTIQESEPEIPEPAPKISESAPKISESAPKISESAPKISESAPKISESAPKISESAPKISESAPKISESAPKISESAPKISEPAPKILESAPKILEPAPEILDISANLLETEATNPEFNWLKQGNVERKATLNLSTTGGGLTKRRAFPGDLTSLSPGNMDEKKNASLPLTTRVDAIVDDFVRSEVMSTSTTKNNMFVIPEECDGNQSMRHNDHQSTPPSDEDFLQKPWTLKEFVSMADLKFQHHTTKRSETPVIEPDESSEMHEQIYARCLSVAKFQVWDDFTKELQSYIEENERLLSVKKKELDENNPAVFQELQKAFESKTEDSVIEKLTSFKRICRYKAFVDWYDRRTKMNNQVLVQLKEQQELLKDDVSTLEKRGDQLDNCMITLDNLNMDFDKKIEDLEGLLEFEEKEWDDYKKTSEEAKIQFETVEQDLQTKENEREQLVGENASLSSEITDEKKRGLELETNIQLIEQKTITGASLAEVKKELEFCQGIQEWILEDSDASSLKFTLLCRTFDLEICFEDVEDCSLPQKIKHINLVSCLSDDSIAVAKRGHSLISENFKNSNFLEMFPTREDIPRLLHMISEAIGRVRGLIEELELIAVNHIVSLNGKLLTIEFSSWRNFIKFIMKFDLSLLVTDGVMPYSVVKKIGAISCETIEQTISHIPSNIMCFAKLIQAADKLLD